MEKITVEEMLKQIEREINLLRKENPIGGYNFDSFSDKKECDRLEKLYNEIAYFRKNIYKFIAENIFSAFFIFLYLESPINKDFRTFA